MTYQSYVERIKRIAVVYDFLRKYRRWILTALITLLILTAGFLGTKGMVISQTTCAPSLVYGETVTCDTKVLFGRATYEYSEKGSDQWVEGVPRMPGDYLLRSVTKRAFGIMDYGDPVELSILPMRTELAVSEAVLPYGDAPTPSIVLAAGDRIAEVDFDYDRYDINPTYIRAVADSVRIVSEDGTDVTAAYEIEVVDTWVDIVPRPVTLVVDGAEKAYDGTPLTQSTWSVSAGSLLPADTAKAVFSASQTIVGSCENTASFTVCNQNGDDVSLYYALTVLAGDLTVTPCPITIRTQGGEHLYDGTPFSCPDYTLAESSTLPEAHRLEIEGWTACIDVAENIPNAYTSISVLLDDGTDVSENFSITCDHGLLTVLPAPLYLLTGSSEKVYDGLPLTDTTLTVLEGSRLVEGDTLSVGKGVELVDADSCENVLADISVTTPDGREVTGNYDISLTYGTLTVRPRPITVTGSHEEWVYDGLVHKASSACVITQGTLVADHRIVTEYTESLQYAGKVENQFSVAVMSGERDVSANYEITCEVGYLTVLPRPVTLQSNGRKIYDGTPLTTSEAEILSELGIVEGEILTVETSGSQTDAGRSDHIITRATVMRGDKDVTFCYDFTLATGALIVDPRPITLRSDGEKVYDGTPLESTLCTDVGTPYALLEGHTATLVTAGSITDVGTADNPILSHTVRDADGRDVTANYAVTYETGTLTVTPRYVTLRSADDQWVYDGLCHTNTAYTTLSETRLVEGHSLLVTRSTEMLDVGQAENLFETYAVVDGDGRDVSHNYILTLAWGMLEITPRPILVKSHTAEKVYDGTPLTDRGFDVSLRGIVSAYPPMVSGDTLSVEESTALIDVGKAANEFLRVTILRTSDGRDVTANYDMTFAWGTLTVHPRSITLLVAGERTYNGRPFKASDLVFVDCGTPYAMLEGHTPDFSFTEDTISVGVYSADLLKVRVFDEKGTDVTGNYLVTLLGEWIIDPAPLQVTSSAEKPYDGLPLTCRTAQYTGFLFPEHEIVLTTRGSQTKIGRSQNRILDVRILDKTTGDDVSANYAVTTEDGTLTVREWEMTIKSGSAHKIYDGTPLTFDYYKVTGDPLPEGFTLKVTVTGSQTEIGSSENIFTYVIFDENGRDVTTELNVTCLEGTLTVKEPSGTSIAGGASTFTVIMYSQLGGSYHLREAYYGDYTGLGFAPAARYFGGALHPMLLSGLAKAQAGADGHIVKIKGTEYTTYDIISGLGPASDTPTDKNGDVYTFEVVRGDYENAVLPEEWQAFEREYRAFAYENFLQIPEDTKAVMLRLAEENGLDPNDPNIIGKVAAYIQGAAEYSFDYDYSGSTDIAVSFLTDVKKGVCAHFSAAATMMYRALGIPARYVTGGVPTTVAGKWAEIEVIAHAWTEVYVDGVGWICMEVTGSGDEVMPETKTTVLDYPSVTIKPLDLTFTYDGLPHGPTGNRYEIIDSELPEGYTITNVIFSEPKIEVGEYESYVKDVTILDGEGRDVTDNCNVNLEYAKLIIEPAIVPLELRPWDLTTVYDGTPQGPEGDQYEIVSGELLEGHTIQNVVYTEKKTDAGTYQTCILSLTVVDETGRDVTDRYNLTFLEGTLTIHRRPIIITTDSAEKVYDGLPLTAQTYTVELKGVASPYPPIVSDHQLVLSDFASVTDVGSVENRVAYRIFRTSDMADMSENYEVTLIFGTLTVTKRFVSLKVFAEKLYDGTAMTPEEITYMDLGDPYALLEGHTPHFTFKVDLIQPGVYDTTVFKTRIKTEDGTDVTKNYQLMITGELIVVRGRLTITTGDAEKQYDGLPLTYGHYEVEGDPLPDGFVLKVTVTGSRTEIGSSRNTFTYVILDADGRDVTDWFSVTCREGTLTVKEADSASIMGGGVSIFEVLMYSQRGGSYHIRDGCYGDYTGTGFAAAPAYTEAEINPMLFAGRAISYAGGVSHIVKIKGTEYVTYSIVNGLAPHTDTPSDKRGDTYTYEIADGSYRSAILPSELQPLEEAYRAFVHENYLSVPDDTREVLLMLAHENGLDPSDPNIIETVAAYIRGAAEYSFDYNYSDSTDVVVSFLTDTKKGVCMHFASAATMMYRALGIPARYVTGGVPTTVAGSWAKIEVIGHAWTEVYVDGVGWICMEVTGSGDEVMPEVETEVLDLPSVTIKPYDISVTYDGGAHGPEGDQYVISNSTLPEGYVVTDVVFTPMYMEVGVYRTSILDFTILDGEGRDVTDQCNVELDYGKLTISEAPLVIRTSDATKYFNGLPLTANEEDDWWISAGKLPEGFEIEVSIGGTLTEPGEVLNWISEVIVYDSEGRDVTLNFNIIEKPGTLTVKLYEG